MLGINFSYGNAGIPFDIFSGPSFSMEATFSRFRTGRPKFDHPIEYDNDVPRRSRPQETLGRGERTPQGGRRAGNEQGTETALRSAASRARGRGSGTGAKWHFGRSHKCGGPRVTAGGCWPVQKALSMS